MASANCLYDLGGVAHMISLTWHDAVSCNDQRILSVQVLILSVQVFCLVTVPDDFRTGRACAQAAVAASHVRTR